MKTALITGITGQDGSYLAELLLQKGYTVHGIDVPEVLCSVTHQHGHLAHLSDRVRLHAASVNDSGAVFAVAQEVRPDECYHLAARSFVSHAREDEHATLLTNIGGTHAVLSAILEAAPECRVIVAGSSEMFGRVLMAPQDESAPFNPISLYGISKVAGCHLARYYREVHGMHVSCGILYNHESPRRGHAFVTRKITRAVAQIQRGTASELQLGSLDAIRDWGYAPEYVEAMWLMLQQDAGDDYVIATGEAHSVREFCETAFAHAGLDWRQHVKTDPQFVRPVETTLLRGNPAKAARVLGWSARTRFHDLVAIMVDADLASMP